eukprot:CAMPEP_0173384124 /NCGR_PEP_ID=MMETSP1356-20130122/6696_1 /TAXON_ID=77927 ORGANISM="Hemiselmis virescens, Strain PCC157" /NCGR_SAMPLE_ID=MMETSP1356 /ASSEMBLY_ACC=CAM_ASM_000847 /LENGTH=78 /DNA_ID=CAMNT_0014339317 /DNA_START=190 /DNA_END=422 /DNA_ORIENTATION=+
MHTPRLRFTRHPCAHGPMRRLSTVAEIGEAILARLLQHAPDVVPDVLARVWQGDVLVDELVRVVFGRRDDDVVLLPVL